MGLLMPVAEFIIKEHVNRPFGPKVLFIGRQTVPLSLESLNTLLAKYGLKNKNKGPVEYDTETRGSERYRFITDRYFMKALGLDDFEAMDVTDYEGADLIHDLGEPIGKEHYSKYDFIYNGGCFDNMFNPGIGLMNLSKLLKPKGRMICMESAGTWNGPYVMFSPAWFYDFYVTNKYQHCAVYLASYQNNNDLTHGPWKMEYVNMTADPGGPSPEALNRHLLLLVIAEKSSESTDSVQPIQFHYRTTAELQDNFRCNEDNLRENDRPLLNGMIIDPKTAPYLINVGFFGEVGPSSRRIVVDHMGKFLVRAGYVIGLIGKVIFKIGNKLNPKHY